MGRRGEPLRQKGPPPLHGETSKQALPNRRGRRCRPSSSPPPFRPGARTWTHLLSGRVRENPDRAARRTPETWLPVTSRRAISASGFEPSRARLLPMARKTLAGGFRAPRALPAASALLLLLVASALSPPTRAAEGAARVEPDVILGGGAVADGAPPTPPPEAAERERGGGEGLSGQSCPARESDGEALECSVPQESGVGREGEQRKGQQLSEDKEPAEAAAQEAAKVNLGELPSRLGRSPSRDNAALVLVPRKQTRCCLPSLFQGPADLEDPLNPQAGFPPPLPSTPPFRLPCLLPPSVTLLPCARPRRSSFKNWSAEIC